MTSENSVAENINNASFAEELSISKGTSNEAHGGQ
jgi:hypothetical protein